MVDLCNTVEELARCDGILVIICQECGHGGLQPGHIVAYFHGKGKRRIDALRYKCGKCGSKKTFAKAYIPATHDAVSKIVQDEMEV